MHLQQELIRSHITSYNFSWSEHLFGRLEDIFLEDVIHVKEHRNVDIQLFYSSNETSEKIQGVK